MEIEQDQRRTELGVEKIKKMLEEIFARSHGWNTLNRRIAIV